MDKPNERVFHVLMANVERRQKLKRSQETIAHAAGVSVRHYQKLENGSIDPRLSTLLNVAIALDTSLQTLLDTAKRTT